MTTLIDTVPAALGYRMPAEWEPHAATWLAWPHYEGDWPGKFDPIPWVYAEIIRNLAKHEELELIANNAAGARKARRILERADAWSSNIRFHRWRTNRVWLRDSGCIFVSSNKDLGNLALKFRFNAWAKYPNWRFDDKIGSLMVRGNTPALSRKQSARRLGHPRGMHPREIHPVSNGKRIVLEGGRSMSMAPVRSSPPKSAC